MERTLVEFTAETRERQRFIEVLFDKAADLADKVGLATAAQCLGAAAEAGTKTGTLGGFRRREKADIFAPRTTGRT